MSAESISHGSVDSADYRVPTYAMATMGLIYSFASMLCLPYSFLPMVNNPWAFHGFSTPPETAWVLGATLVELGLGFLLFVGSMGAFSYAIWSRQLLLLWSWITLAWGFVGLFFYVSWLFPANSPNIAIVRGEGPWGGMVFWGIDWIFAACMLYHLTRSWVRDRFASGEPAIEL